MDVQDVVYDVIDEAEQRPAEWMLKIQLMKWQEESFYPSESIYNEATRDIIVSLTLERMRRQTVDLDETITDYFDNLPDDVTFHLDDVELHQRDEHFVENYVRDILVTPPLLAFYNYYVEMMKVIQSTLLLRGVFGRGFDEQDEAQDFLYDQLGYPQRENLLYWSGIISDDLRSNMARIRGRRNSIIHTLEAGNIEDTEHAIDDIDLCVEVMQELCELDMRETALGTMDTIVEAMEEESENED